MFEDYRTCFYCMDGMRNKNGETLAWCGLYGRWRNITLGYCIGNCEHQIESIRKYEDYVRVSGKEDMQLFENFQEILLDKSKEGRKCGINSKMGIR